MIAQADVVAVHCVDQIEVSPHKPVTPVYRIEAALNNAGPGIELAPRVEAIALQGLRFHAEWLKRYLIVTVTFVEPPGVIQQAFLRFQPPVKGRAGERGEMIEGGNIERVLFRKIDRLRKAFRRVAVVSENECAINANAVTAQVAQRNAKAALHAVEGLIHIFEVCRIEALE